MSTQQQVHKHSLRKEFLLVIVLSARGAFERRRAIRETWAKGHSNVFFVVGRRYCSLPPQYRARPWLCTEDGATGTPPPRHGESYQAHLETYTRVSERETRLLESEPQTVLLDMVDYYRALPRKVKLSFLWAYENFDFEYIAKVDDDCFMRVASTAYWLQKRYHLRDKREYIVGAINPPEIKSRFEKWHETKYTKRLLPPFTKGAAYILNRDVLDIFRANPDNVVEYQGEDTSLGIWFQEYNINVKWVVVKNITAVRGRECTYPWKFIVSHDISPKQQYICSNIADETPEYVGSQRSETDGGP